MNYQLKLRSWVIALVAGVVGWLVSGNVAIGGALFGAFLLPALIALYIPYAKDNPQHLWFKRKLYGWGWTPVRWQGWVTIAVYIGVITLLALTVNDSTPTKDIVLRFGLPLAFCTLILFRILYKKGESPRWQWGRDDRESK